MPDRCGVTVARMVCKIVQNTVYLITTIPRTAGVRCVGKATAHLSWLKHGMQEHHTTAAVILHQSRDFSS
jgi:hypothetical protein